MSNVKIHAQYIKDLSFKISNTPDIFLNPQDKPDVGLSIDIDAKKISEDGLHEIILKISATATQAKAELFKCDLSYAGLFNISKVKEDMIEQILLIYCPNLLFPFLRKIIASTTADAGLSPLMLDPIDFAALYARKKKVENSEPINDTQN